MIVPVCYFFLVWPLELSRKQLSQIVTPLGVSKKNCISHQQNGLLCFLFSCNEADNMQLSAVPWRCVVIDEAHRLKNRNCKLLEGLNNLSMV